jgi:hypothetical protein
VGAVRVTVAGPCSRVDVALADDVPVGEIIPDLVRRSVAEPRPSSRWALGPPGGEPFRPGLTLRALGVVAGTDLQLRDMVAPETEVRGAGTGEAAAQGDAERDALRLRVTALAERLIGDVAGIRAGRNPLLGYAAPEARRRLRALVPGPFDRAAESGFSGLSLAVTWHRDPLAPIEALARFVEIAPDGAPRDARRQSAPRPGAAAAARRISLRMTLDPACHRLLEVAVSAEPPFS